MVVQLLNSSPFTMAWTALCIYIQAQAKLSDTCFMDEDEEERRGGWNKKAAKDRTSYGRCDPINRMIACIADMTVEDALAWISIIANCNPNLKAEIYSWWADMMVDAGLVQNSCYVACLPCMWDRYVDTFRFLHEQARDENIQKIDRVHIPEHWVKEHFDLLMWQNR